MGTQILKNAAQYIAAPQNISSFNNDGTNIIDNRKWPINTLEPIIII